MDRAWVGAGITFDVRKLRRRTNEMKCCHCCDTRKEAGIEDRERACRERAERQCLSLDPSTSSLALSYIPAPSIYIYSRAVRLLICLIAWRVDKFPGKSLLCFANYFHWDTPYHGKFRGNFTAFSRKYNF